MITKETYAHLIARAMYDERLSMGDFCFLVRFIYLLDSTDQPYIHWPYRQFIDAIKMSMGSVGNAIEQLQKYEYIHGTLEAKPEGRQSWKLWLADMPEPTPIEPPKPPVVAVDQRYENLRIQVIIEEVDPD